MTENIKKKKENLLSPLHVFVCVSGVRVTILGLLPGERRASLISDRKKVWTSLVNPKTCGWIGCSISVAILQATLAGVPVQLVSRWTGSWFQLRPLGQCQDSNLGFPVCRFITRYMEIIQKDIFWNRHGTNSSFAILNQLPKIVIVKTSFKK